GSFNNLQPFDAASDGPGKLVKAPFGSGSWGVVASSNASDGKLDGFHVAIKDGSAYLYGAEASGHWGQVKFVQGNVWHSEGVPWHAADPVPAYGSDLWLQYRTMLGDVTANGPDDLVIAFDAWFSSPDLAKRGKDRNGKKPIVIDMRLYSSRPQTRDAQSVDP